MVCSLVNISYLAADIISFFPDTNQGGKFLVIKIHIYAKQSYHHKIVCKQFIIVEDLFTVLVFQMTMPDKQCRAVILSVHKYSLVAELPLIF